jgi:hypothetical protein
MAEMGKKKESFIQIALMFPKNYFLRSIKAEAFSGETSVFSPNALAALCLSPLMYSR